MGKQKKQFWRVYYIIEDKSGLMILKSEIVSFDYIVNEKNKGAFEEKINSIIANLVDPSLFFAIVQVKKVNGRNLTPYIAYTIGLILGYILGRFLF